MEGKYLIKYIILTVNNTTPVNRTKFVTTMDIEKTWRQFEKNQNERNSVEGVSLTGIDKL